MPLDPTSVQQGEKPLVRQNGRNGPGQEVLPEQIRYAALLWYGGRVGLVALVIGQILYLSGLLPASIIPRQLPDYWGLRAEEFLRITHMPTGWQWLRALHGSDGLNMLGIVWLASIHIVGLAMLAITYGKQRDFLYAGMALLSFAVLVLAASGVLAVGGH